MSHCSKCCSVTEQSKGVAMLLVIGLATFTVPILAPESWTGWEKTAAIVGLIGLWR